MTRTHDERGAVGDAASETPGDEMRVPHAVSPYDEMGGYLTPTRVTPVDLVLDANEGPACVGERVIADGLAIDAETLRRYPSEAALESSIAERFGLPPDWCMVTPGADAALERLIRVYAAGERELVVPTPTFAMIPIYARFGGVALRSPAWPDERFPLDKTLAAIDERVGLVVIVSPNNPTGAVAGRDALFAVAERAADAGAALLLDAAYIEFADGDPTIELLERFPRHAMVTRTMSKAWGLAGARVGCVLGAPQLLRPARVAGGPYTVASPSLAIAARALEGSTDDVVAATRRVVEHRRSIESLARSLGMGVVTSQSNSVFFRTGGEELAAWVRDGLLGLGVAVRAFGGVVLSDAIRVTVPDDLSDERRVEHALHATLAPEAVLLDIDGVVADVSGSYRRCIIETARRFGVDISDADVSSAKRAGGANNDWELTRRLIIDHGREDAKVAGDTPTLDAVRDAFERLYQGENGTPGLHERETLITPAEMLARLASKIRLAAVTGRPRRDAERFLTTRGVHDCFDLLVCMEDTAAAKPDPDPVRRALDGLGVRRAWMLGDTPDDVRAAREAGVVPIGVPAPGDDAAAASLAMQAAGAGLVVPSFDEFAALVERVLHASGGVS